MTEVDWRELPEAIYLLDEAGGVRDLNVAARALLGFDRDATLCQVSLALDPEQSLLARLAGPAGPGRSFFWQSRCCDGTPVLLDLRASNRSGCGWLLCARTVVGDLATQLELQRRLEFERLITSASAALIRAGHERLDAVITETLGSIGRFFGVDRAYLFRIDAAVGSQSNTHEWVAAGISAEADNLQDVPLSVFPWLLEQLREDRLVSIPRVDRLPSAAVAERAEFEREGIQSVMIVPLWHGDELNGFVGFDAVRRTLDWGEEFAIGLRLMAQMLAGALESRTLALRLRTLAFYDPLTGLANRKLLEDRLEGALQRARRSGKGLLLAMVDVDDFKQVNDSHGHAVGDLLLREIACRLQAAVRECDTAARLGGDEFVLLVEGSGPESGPLLAARLMQLCDAAFELDDLRLQIGVSAGLAFAPAGAVSSGELMRRADVAMYRAKADGKRCWRSDTATGDG